VGKLSSVKSSFLQALAQFNQAGSMSSLLDLMMLICAAVGSMAFGILAAYGVLRVGFAFLRPQRRPVPVKTQEAVVVSEQ
jgi:hypothetical protein